MLDLENSCGTTREKHLQGIIDMCSPVTPAMAFVINLILAGISPVLQDLLKIFNQGDKRTYIIGTNVQVKFQIQKWAIPESIGNGILHIAGLRPNISEKIRML